MIEKMFVAWILFACIPAVNPRTESRLLESSNPFCLPPECSDDETPRQVPHSVSHERSTPKSPRLLCPPQGCEYGKTIRSLHPNSQDFTSWKARLSSQKLRQHNPLFMYSLQPAHMQFGVGYIIIQRNQAALTYFPNQYFWIVNDPNKGKLLSNHPQILPR